MDSNPLTFVDSGSWVWYNHDDLAWAPCKVLTGGADVELENGETHERYSAPGARGFRSLPLPAAPFTSPTSACSAACVLELLAPEEWHRTASLCILHTV
eukprot:COSAG01_NODE_18256_length_1088_cov_43.439838_2_plen_99_part_00